MPTISTFYGIIIMMYLKDKEHNPPHIHAFYGEEAATFYISSGDIYEGNFPTRAKKWLKNSLQNIEMSCFRCGNLEVIKN